MAAENMKKIIGYWLSEKKLQKLNWSEFESIAESYGYELVKLDLKTSLEDQGPFTLLLYKITDLIVLANQGDTEAKRVIREIEKYMQDHPEVAIMDPLENVMQLLDRYRYYSVINQSKLLSDINVFTPLFAEITSDNVEDNIIRLRNAGVKFPFVCKTQQAQGSSDVHKMSIIFNEKGVKDCKPPSVAQTFINHNAVLYKVFCVGDKYVIVERPSLKNFYSNDEETIFFSSSDVSKSDSTSSLNLLDEDDPFRNNKPTPPDRIRIEKIVRAVRNEIGIMLLGIDIVIENNTDKYAIIDINTFPGYDGFPNFFECLMECIIETIEKHNKKVESKRQTDIYHINSTTTTSKYNNNQNEQDLDSGFDTSDSSDEKNRRQLNEKFKIR